MHFMKSGPPTGTFSQMSPTRPAEFESSGVDGSGLLE